MWSEKQVLLSRICKSVLRRWNQEAPAGGSHHHHPQIQSLHGRFIVKCTYLHTWSSFITQIIVVIELQLVAFIQSKTVNQLSWLLNQIVKAMWIKIKELDLKVTVKHIASKPIYLFCFDYETCYIRFIARVTGKICAKFQKTWSKMPCVHDKQCKVLPAHSIIWHQIHRTSFY